MVGSDDRELGSFRIVSRWILFSELPVLVADGVTAEIDVVGNTDGGIRPVMVIFTTLLGPTFHIPPNWNTGPSAHLSVRERPAP